MQRFKTVSTLRGLSVTTVNYYHFNPLPTGHALMPERDEMHLEARQSYEKKAVPL